MPAIPDEAARRHRRVGYACAAGIVMIWAGFSLMSRWSGRSGGSGLTPWDLGALRFGIAGVAASMLWLAGIGRGLGWRRGIPLAALGGTGFALPSYLGFSLAPTAHGALVLSGTLPFLVAIGTWFAFGERWGRARQVSLVLLLLGFFLFGTEAYWRQHAPPGAWRGDLLFLLGSISWAGYTILARRWRPTAAQAMVAVSFWCGVAYVPVWWAALPSHLADTPMQQLLPQALFQGIVTTLISLPLYTRALDGLGTARLTTVTALVPGTAALLAVPLLDEPLGLLSLLGLALVGVAVAVAVGGRPEPTADPRAGS